MPDELLHEAIRRMQDWATANPHADTQGLMPDEWEGLARAALCYQQTEYTDARLWPEDEGDA